MYTYTRSVTHKHKSGSLCSQPATAMLHARLHVCHSEYPYTLRPRRHDCCLSLADSRNFLIRQLLKDMYSLLVFLFFYTHVHSLRCQLC